MGAHPDFLRRPPEKPGRAGALFWEPPKKTDRAGVFFWAPPENTGRAGVLFWEPPEEIGHGGRLVLGVAQSPGRAGCPGIARLDLLHRIN